MSEVKQVYTAIAKVASYIAKEGISKGRKNQQQGYAFRGVDDIYNALASSLVESGLIIIPRIVSRECREVETKSGGRMNYVTVEAEYDFVSTNDGSMHTARVVGEAMDSADKATNKAMSAAYKYLCIQTFCIPTEGDNDADATTHEVVSSKQQPQKQQQNGKYIDVAESIKISIDACNTQKELVDLYNKNKNVVDSNPLIQQLISNRRNTINGKKLNNA